MADDTHARNVPRITRLVIRKRVGDGGQPQFVLEQQPPPPPLPQQHQHHQQQQAVRPSVDAGLGEGTAGPREKSGSLPAALQMRLYAQKIPSRKANFLMSQDLRDFARSQGERSSNCLAKVREMVTVHRRGGSGGATAAAESDPTYCIFQLRNAGNRRPTRRLRAVVSVYGDALRVGVPTPQWRRQLPAADAATDSKGRAGLTDKKAAAAPESTRTDTSEEEGAGGDEWEAALRALRRMLVTGECRCPLH